MSTFSYPSSWLLYRQSSLPRVNYCPTIALYNHFRNVPRVPYILNGQPVPDFNTMFRYDFAMSELTLNQLAEISSVSRATIQHYYKDSSPRLDNYNKLALVFSWPLVILRAHPDSIIPAPVLVSPKYEQAIQFAELLTVLRISAQLTTRQAAIHFCIDSDEWNACEQLLLPPSDKLRRRSFIAYNRLKFMYE